MKQLKQIKTHCKEFKLKFEGMIKPSKTSAYILFKASSLLEIAVADHNYKWSTVKVRNYSILRLHPDGDVTYYKNLGRNKNIPW